MATTERHILDLNLGCLVLDDYTSHKRISSWPWLWGLGSGSTSFSEKPSKLGYGRNGGDPGR